MDYKFDLYKDMKAMKNELNDIHFIKNKTTNRRRKLLPDEWIKLNDIFNRFVSHKRKHFKRIKDGYMIL